MQNETYPKETIALNDDELSTELAAIYIPDIVIPEGGMPLLERRMRCRILECHPGKIIALHSHKNRPALLYVLQGSGEEHNNQFSEARIWKEGDCFAEFNDTEHWIKNRSDVIPLRVLTFDLIDDGPAPQKCDSGC
ncbi:cupin domain-containing protein [Scandinavium manionii]|uniref:cupin domain-containing protein n=1 Tax=Scandinavium manionii TaxID=2926520 RepID=UPI00216617D1|nr:cupin domain-containing protein [Scandinavium manionii]MCS2164522.1 cupin domain-containing protein [Scandinavium manionii]